MSRTKLSPAKKRALRSKRRTRLLAAAASLPAVVYVVYRVITFVKTI